MRYLAPLYLVVLLAAMPARAEPWSGGAVDTGSEVLHYSPPDGLELGFEDHKANLDVLEFVRADETVEDWTDNVTVLTIARPANLTIEVFFSSMSSGIADGCAIEAAIRRPEFFVDGPYQAGVQSALCGRTKRHGRAQAMLFKAILGDKAAYVVQRAWNFPPQAQSSDVPITGEMLTEAAKNLNTMQVCDSTMSQDPCPAPR